MRIPELCRALLFTVALSAAACGVTAAGESFAFSVANALDETIVEIRVMYAVPGGKPRFDRFRVNLPAGGEYRLEGREAGLPEQLIVDLAETSHVFEDLSGLAPTSGMRVAADRGEEVPRLRRLDGEGTAQGAARNYLSAANRPNAVDKADLATVGSLDAVGDLIIRHVDEQLARMGDLERFDVEAGPIMDHAHAGERCPEAVREWSGANGREARWTGHWRTTVPGEMSVCGCMTGTADDEETIAFELDGWGKRAFFPVSWKGRLGVGMVEEAGVFPNGVAVAMRFRLPDDAPLALLRVLMEDLLADGFSPTRFSLRAGEVPADGDGEDMRETEIDFRTKDGDKRDAFERVMAALRTGYASPALEGTLTWVEDGAIERVKAGEKAPETRGVLCFFGKGVFEAVFLPGSVIFLK